MKFRYIIFILNLTGENFFVFDTVSDCCKSCHVCPALVYTAQRPASSLVAGHILQGRRAGLFLTIKDKQRRRKFFV